MSDRGEDQPGWAVPDQPARDPAAPATTGAAGADWWGEPAAAPGAPVPPPYAAAGAPRQPRKRGWLVALLAVLALILVMAVVGTVLFITRTYPPYATARDFLTDFGNGRTGSTVARLCAADRAHPNLTLQRIRGAIDQPDARTFSANALGVDRSGNTATVDFTVTYNGGRKDRTFSLPLREEHGSWKVCLTPA